MRRYDKYGNETMVFSLWCSDELPAEQREWLDTISKRRSLKFSEQDKIESLYLEIFGYYGAVTKSDMGREGLVWSDVSQKLIENGWGQQKSPIKVLFTSKFKNEHWDDLLKIFGEDDCRKIRAFSIFGLPEMN